MTSPLPGTVSTQALNEAGDVISTQHVDLAVLIASQDDEIALVALGILESRWRTLHNCRDSQCWGYEPYPQDMFRRLLEPAIAAVGKDHPVFLDAGAGIGAKGLYAQRLGCQAYGIEHNPHLVAEARRIGASVTEGDVADLLPPNTEAGPHGIRSADILFSNSPYRDPGMQAAFEAKIAETMQPGAVLILGNKCGPDPDGWERLTTVIERDGAWKKPST